MSKFTKEQLMKLAEIHLIEVEDIDLDVDIRAKWAHLFAHRHESYEVVVSELLIFPSENIDQRIQSFLSKVKEVNHD